MGRQGLDSNDTMPAYTIVNLPGDGIGQYRVVATVRPS